jgi:pyruvate kinase
MTNSSTAQQSKSDEAHSAPSKSPSWKVPEIMATLGPTMEKQEDLNLGIKAGIRWVRLPCGYRQRPHVKNAQTALDAASEAGQPVQVLLDLPSSRPRTGTMDDLNLALGEKVLFWDPEAETHAPLKNGAHPVPLPGLHDLKGKLAPSHRILFCDGRLTFVIDELQNGFVKAHLAQGTTTLKASNALFLPDSWTGFTAITPPDHALFKEFGTAGLIPDWVALSLIASPEDVIEGRADIHKILGDKVRIMAKFETIAAVECIDAIIAVSDGVMVARGDLGQAVGYARLPGVQEQIVAAARRAGKPVVVATQILESFAATGLPQRAELSDLSLIARQRADAIMLGKETVFSPRPLDCIRLASEVLTHETRRFEQQYGS